MQRCDFKCAGAQFIKADCNAPECSSSKHQQMNNNDKLYEYNECDSVPFPTNGASASLPNSKTQSQERPYKCDLCIKAFKRMDHLKRHTTIHTGEKAFVCDICDKAYTRQDKMKLHRNGHLVDKPYKPPPRQQHTCHAHHAQHSHAQQGGFNGSVYAKSQPNHQQPKNKPFKCQVCDKAFSNNHHLKRHMLIHTRDKAFKCDMCDKGFTRQDKYNSHRIAHTEKKLSKGETRQEAFYNTGFGSHSRSHFQNEQCSADMSKKTGMGVHVGSQTGDKVYQCKECNTQFQFEDILNDHIAVYHNMLKGISMGTQQAV